MATEKQVEGNIELGPTAQDYSKGEIVAGSGCDAQVQYVDGNNIIAKVIPDEKYCGNCVLVCDRRKKGGEPLFDNNAVVE